jgi:hypothetical protein
VPASAGGPQPAPQDQWTLRDYTAGSGAARIPGKNFEHEPMIAVLSPYLAGPAADIRTGQALPRVLLTATVLGLSVSFLSQIVEIATAREELRRLISGTRPPLAVLRIGRGGRCRPPPGETWPTSSSPIPPRSAADRPQPHRRPS